MFSIKLVNDLVTNKNKSTSGNLLFELDGKQFGHSAYETTSIPYTLTSLKNFKKNEIYGISKIDFCHSTKELYIRIFEKNIQLITYKRTNRAELEIISKEISIEAYENAVKQLERSYYQQFPTKKRMSII